MTRTRVHSVACSCVQVASSAGRFLEIMQETVNPEKLRLLVLSNVGIDREIYGSAIAYLPGSYDFDAMCARPCS